MDLFIIHQFECAKEARAARSLRERRKKLDALLVRICYETAQETKELSVKNQPLPKLMAMGYWVMQGGPQKGTFPGKLVTN